MARMSIRRVQYWGKRYRYVSPTLKDGINILVGENGSGKTTFANLLYFGLGGRVDSFLPTGAARHAEIASDENNYVELAVEIDAMPYTFRRYFGTNDIGVTKRDGEVEVHPVYRQHKSVIFSDWLLRALGIEPFVLDLGGYSGYLNNTDLMRLIYHDQAPDPSDIYKAPDTGSFVPNSRVVKKAIFEILIGKGFQEYYSALAHVRTLDTKKAELSASLDLYKRFMIEIQPDRRDMNKAFIEKRIEEGKQQLQRTESYRKSMSKKVPRQGTDHLAEEKKQQLIAAELQADELNTKETELLGELSRLQRGKSDLVLEVTQIKKMMFTHDSLSLFSPNTCPYCLREVTREPHKCVCGAAIEEGEYERFFYDSKDYLEILKAKQRNVETMEGAIQSCREELNDCRERASARKEETRRLRTAIATLIEDVDTVTLSAELEEIEEKSLSLRADLDVLTRQLTLETRRQELEDQSNKIVADLERARARMLELQGKSESAMNDQRELFSEMYNTLMHDTVADVRVARIDSDYMPVINNGEYKAISVNVPKRLLYFVTMLNMSLHDASIRFPRFLLIDTPETAGIDRENLIQAMKALEKVLQADDNEHKCQVIMTTGPDRYPETFRDRVFGELTQDKRLLVAVKEAT